ncbi:bactofilin family protein [Pararhodonellum marinum]|uniref:bactofilin family protein n=1 Tax=Pararhodonellum marinum TaxID=2755358 RepID=UPI00188F5D12|nr:polymer-forming cytoskeletal protein [Pararhodonellum marinum]
MFNNTKTEEKKSVAQMVNSSNLIAKETKIVGDIITQGNIRIEGVLEGTLDSKNKIVIGESAKVIGSISATEAEIAGHVKGVINCSDILFLKKTAQIEGDIFTKKLVVENGAVFIGQCNMTGNKPTHESNGVKPKAREKELV